MMNYFTAMASPVYDFPYSGYQTHSIPNVDNDIDAILANITPPLGGSVYNQLPSITLQCVPQINMGAGNNTMVYQVSENMPIEAILEQLGINSNTLQPSNNLSNYYRSTFQPMEIYLPPASDRPRRLVCREVSDSEDDSYLRRPSHRHHRRHSSSEPTQPQQQQPVNLHNLLNRVWQKAERGSENLSSSVSAPNLNSQWQSMRNASSSPPPPPNYNANNAWQAMRNAPPPISQDHRNAVTNAWQKADYASELNANRLSNTFNRMRQPTGGLPPQNREAVHDFMAARNLPYGINLPPPNQEAVHDFMAARNLPYGINLPPPNREAVQDFMAARNLPYGINLPPPNREAVQEFMAVRNLPPGLNQPPPNREAVQEFMAVRNLPPGLNQPPPNREAVQNFLAARNLPYGMNQPNPAVSNVWNRADNAVHQGPPMINIPWNQMQSSPANPAWNRMQQGRPLPFNPPYPNAPFGASVGRPVSAPAPVSFASILSQAQRQRSAYAGTG